MKLLFSTKNKTAQARQELEEQSQPESFRCRLHDCVGCVRHRSARAARTTFILLAIGLLGVVAGSYAILAQLMVHQAESVLLEYSDSLSKRIDSSMSAKAIDEEISSFKHYHPDAKVSVIPVGTNHHFGDYLAVDIPQDSVPRSGMLAGKKSYPGAPPQYGLARSEDERMYVVVSADETEYLQSLASLRVVFGVIGLVGVGSLALAWVVRADAYNQSVKCLQGALDRMHQERILRQVPICGADQDKQVAQLSESINTLLKECHHHSQRFAHLMADAGHELKTPLTALRINIELLMELNATLRSREERQGQLSVEETRELENSIRTQLDELTMLIEEVVEVSLHDSEETPLEIVQLDEVVRSALVRARPRAEAHQVSLDVHLEEWELEGNFRLLERMVLNLIDNAVKWSPEGEQVHITTAEINEDTALLMVSDHGRGIPADDLPYIFERYYRSQHQEGTAAEVPGTGLGLHICQQVVELHGGNIQLWETDPLDVEHPGLTVSVVLPRG